MVTKFDEEHLRQFIAARARNDAAEMRRCWEELVIDFADRMDGFVAAAHRGRLDDDEHDLAVAMALAKFSTNLVTTFDGVSIGQLVNATKKLASFICMDVQRSSMRVSKHEGPSLDTGWDAGAEDRPAASWDAAEARYRFELDERSVDVRSFLEWALPQVESKQREVLELTFEGLEVPEIAEALGITRDNVFQRRSRGMKHLKQLKEQYDA